MSEAKSNLKASFVLDSNGKPIGRSTGNYEIKVSVDNAPEDAYATTYRLHDSYYDPIREAYSKEDGFTQDITSYGDYIITARIRTKSSPIEIKESLYNALLKTHGNDTDPVILKALDEIRSK
jgi:hypothetical protein